MQNDLHKVFNFSDYNNSKINSSSPNDSAAGADKYKSLLNLNSNNNINNHPTPAANSQFEFLIRNNVFLRVTDIVSKSYIINSTTSASTTANENKTETKKQIEYYEVVFEFQKHQDLSSEYKKTFELLQRKLSHIINLEYDYDYLYLFDILQGLEMNEALIELIKDLIAKNPIALEDELHSVEVREDHPEYVLSLNNLSSLYFNQENYKQALEFYLECMQIEEKYLTEKTNPNLGITYNNIATVHNKLNNFEDALKFYFKNLETEKHNYGETSLECAATLNNIGIVYDNMGDFKMAVGYYRDALRIREQLSEEDNAELGNFYNNLAVALDNEGKLQEAKEYYTKSLRILHKHCGAEHHDVVTILWNISDLEERIVNNNIKL